MEQVFIGMWPILPPKFTNAIKLGKEKRILSILLLKTKESLVMWKRVMKIQMV